MHICCLCMPRQMPLVFGHIWADSKPWWITTSAAMLAEYRCALLALLAAENFGATKRNSRELSWEHARKWKWMFTTGPAPPMSTLTWRMSEEWPIQVAKQKLGNDRYTILWKTDYSAYSSQLKPTTPRCFVFWPPSTIMQFSSGRISENHSANSQNIGLPLQRFDVFVPTLFLVMTQQHQVRLLYGNVSTEGLVGHWIKSFWGWSLWHQSHLAVRSFCDEVSWVLTLKEGSEIGVACQPPKKLVSTGVNWWSFLGCVNTKTKKYLA